MEQRDEECIRHVLDFEGYELSESWIYEHAII